MSILVVGVDKRTSSLVAGLSMHYLGGKDGKAEVSQKLQTVVPSSLPASSFVVAPLYSQGSQ
jgi:hypothetical protein